MGDNRFSKNNAGAIACAIFIAVAVFSLAQNVSAAAVDSVILVSPANNTWTTQNNDTLSFEFYYTGANATASCELFINNVLVAENTTVYNNTNTSLFSNTTISEGTSTWFVNCTNDTTTVQSGINNLKVDRTYPTIVIYSPQNTTYSTTSLWLNYTYNETNADTCWYEYNGTNTTITCGQNQSFTAPEDQTSGITLYINDSAGNTNASSVYFTVSIPPREITPVLGEQHTANTSWVLVNITFTEPNPSTCLLEWNTQTNYTMSINITEGYCWYNLTGLSDGIYNYSVYINDTAGNLAWNGTWSVTVETTAPSITINSPLNNTNTSRSSMTFNWTVTDSVASSFVCSLWVNGSLVNNSISAQNSTPVTYTVPGFSIGQSNWTVNCSDGSYNSTSGVLFFGAYPDLSVTSIVWNSTGLSSGDNHTTQGSNITVSVTVSNTGDFNIDENVTLTLKWRGHSDYVNNATVTIPNTSLTSGSSYTYQYYHKINTQYVTFGWWPITAVISTNASEASQSNNTLTIYTTVGYNITLSRAYGWAENNGTHPARADPGEGVLFNVSVTYANGDPVTGLASQYFHLSETSPNSSRTYSLSGFQNSSSDYWFNITTPSLSNGYIHTGIYTLSLNVTNSNYTGTLTMQYNLTAPDISQHNVVGLANMDLEGHTNVYEYVNISIPNTGNKPIYNVSISYDCISSGCDMTVGSGGHCWDIDTLNPGTTNTTACVHLRVLATSEGTKTIYVNVSGYDGDSRFYYKYKTYSFTVDNTQNTTSTSSSQSSSNSQSSSTQSSTSSPYAVSITSYTSSFTTYPNSTIKTTVKVKNTGNATFAVTLSVILSQFSSKVLPAERTLSAGEEGEFSVEITIPNSTDIGQYTGTFKAAMKDSTSVVDEKSFKIIIEATPEKAEEINETFANYTSQFEELMERFDVLNSSGLINETNLTAVRSLLDEISTLIQQINSSINKGDYVTANSLMANLEAKIKQADDAITELESQENIILGTSIAGAWFWIMLVVIIIVIGAFAYYTLYMQKPGYEPTRGYRPVGEKSPPGILNKISSVTESLTAKMKDVKDSAAARVSKPKQSEPLFQPAETRPAYTTDYKKHSFSDYTYHKSTTTKLKEKLKNLFKRRNKAQKTIGDFYTPGSTRII